MKVRMWEWFQRRSTPSSQAEAPSVAPRGRQTAGRYRFLHDYLRTRYADTVVLTFNQMEDLLGFTLPAEASSDQEWWARSGVNPADSHCADAWLLANRTARPNLQARIVVFDRSV
jgi:hypothetical protein